MDLVNWCRVCLDRAHMTSKYLHISNLETVIRACNRNLPNKQSGCTNDRLNGHSPMEPRRRRPFHKHRFSSQNGSQWQRQTPLTGKSDNCPYRRQGTVFFLNPCRDVQQEPITDRQDKPKNLGVWDIRMGSSHVFSHPTQRNTTSGDHLDVADPAAATVLPSDVKNAKELDIDEKDAIAWFKMKNYKFHMINGINSSMLIETDSDFDTGPGPNPVRKSFLPVK